FDTLGAFSGFAAGVRFTVTAYQETNAAITYTGTWTTLKGTGFWGGALKYTTGGAGTKASFAFTGGRVALVATQTSSSGKADIYLDGVLKGTIDLYSSTTHNRRVVFVLNGLARTAPGGTAHHLEVRLRS